MASFRPWRLSTRFTWILVAPVCYVLAVMGELCRKLEEVADIADEDLFVVPHTVDAARALSVARDKVLGGVLRPDDIHAATIDEPVLAYVPFWRVEVAVDGMHVSFPVRVSTRKRSIPLPMPGYRHRESVALVLARRLFPYPPNHVERSRGHVFGGSTTHGGWHGIDIRLEDMRPLRESAIAAGELIEPDVTRSQAEHEAKKRAEWRARPDSAIYADYAREVRSAACCYYPLYVIRYAYSGHATTDPGASFWVIVCGRTNKIVGGQHPSAIRAVAKKIRKWITF